MSYTGSSFNDWLAEQAWKRNPASHYGLDQAAAVLQLRVGRTLGLKDILGKNAVLKSLFPDRMEAIIKAWMDQFWPYKTGNYHDTVLRDMVVEWKKITVTALNVRSPKGVDYSKYVEKMVGVIWTNAQTVEQPMSSLRSFILTEMIQIIDDLKEECGL